MSSCGEAQPDPRAAPLPAAHYADSLAAVELRRAHLWKRYQQSTDEERRAVLADAQNLMRRSVVGSVIPFWFGTSWDFNGTSETPGHGAIACGYFVTTVLRDSGFRIERAGLAQLPSETMIRSLVDAPHIRRYSDAPIDCFVASVREWGTGLYLVGLDCHTGFIVCEEGDVAFLHSAFAEPFSVVCEDAEESLILAASRYRVLGKLTADPELARRWLAGERTGARKA